jgi:hypothetical protein
MVFQTTHLNEPSLQESLGLGSASQKREILIRMNFVQKRLFDKY